MGAHAGRRDALLTVLLLAPVLLLVLAWPALAPTDPDYWEHVATGRVMAATGAVPSVDLYLFTTAPGQPWVDHEWLTELSYAAVQDRFGYLGNVVLAGLLGCATALALYATCRLWGVGQLPAVVLVLWAFTMSLPSLGVRPQTWTRCFLAVAALLVTVYRVRGRRRQLWLLPLLLAVWANLHGGFVIGLGFLALTTIGAALEALRARSDAELRPLLVATGASVLATLLNANGVAGALYPLAYATPNYGGQTVIAEWQAPDLRDPGFALFALSILLALGLGFARRPLRAAETLWALCFGLLGLQSIRNIQLWATIAMPLIGARLRTDWPAFGRSPRAWRRPARMAVLWTLVVVLGGGVWTARITQAPGWQLQLGREPATSGYPVAGAAYLRDHQLSGNLFNRYDWGGYLVYQLYPRLKLFIDGRPDVYGAGVLQDYLTVADVQPGWQGVLDRYNVQLVLVDRDGPLARTLLRDPGWRLLLTGPVERLFQRG
jgi:hypothetical protein